MENTNIDILLTNNTVNIINKAVDILTRNLLLIISEPYVFIGNYNDNFDNCSTVTLTSGLDPELTLCNGVAVWQPKIQIRVRDDKYDDGYNRCLRIITKLNDQSYDYGHFTYIFYLMTDILSLGKDRKNRSEFTLNFRLQVLGE